MSTRGLVAAAACMAVLAIGSPSAALDRDQVADWRKVATGADRARLRRWRVAWMDALGTVRAGGQGARLATQPLLFDPDRSMPDATIATGRYRCRVFRLGTVARTDKVFVAHDPVDCRVAEGMLTIDGVQRVTGRLFADTDARSIFLGTLAIGDERRTMRYSRDAQRDMAGMVERVAPGRWRLVLPYPRFGSTLDLIEITER